MINISSAITFAIGTHIILSINVIGMLILLVICNSYNIKMTLLFNMHFNF